MNFFVQTLYSPRLTRIFSQTYFLSCLLNRCKQLVKGNFLLGPSIEAIVEGIKFSDKIFFTLPFIHCVVTFQFSSITIVIFDMSCPGKLKWYPVGCDKILFRTYPKCSDILSFISLSLSPIYCFLHLSILH